MSRRDPVPVPRPSSPLSRLKTLTAEYRELKARLEQGGGPDKVRRQHEQGKLTARERIEALLDQGGTWFEIGLLVAFDQYDGQAPGGGVPARPVGRDLHGRRHVVHGAGGPEPREGRDGTDRGRGIPGRRGDSHRSERGGALSRERRS